MAKKKAGKKKAGKKKSVAKKSAPMDVVVAMAEEQAAALKQLVAQNAEATEALVKQSAAATDASLRTTELLERVLVDLNTRVESVETTLQAINEKLERLLAQPTVEPAGEAAVSKVVKPDRDSALLERPPLGLQPTVIEGRATKLSQLLKIRADNQTELDVNGNLGTALGFSDDGNSGEPAIMLFVAPAIHAAWQAGTMTIPDRLYTDVSGEGRVSCRVQVEIGIKSTSSGTSPST